MKLLDTRTYITFYEVYIEYGINDYIHFEDTNYKSYRRKIYYKENGPYFVRNNTKFYMNMLIKCDT